MREIVLKISPPPHVKILRYEKNIMKTEVEVLKLLKVQSNVPVPKVFFYDNSKTLLNNEYFFMEKLNGQSYNKIKESLSEKEQEKIETELGMYNSAINHIKGEKFGYFSQPDRNCIRWSQAFHMMINDILQDGKDYNIKLPLAYEEINEFVLKRTGILDIVIEPRLIHWDLHDGNVIINNEGKIAGIIDCDRAMWGDPLIEAYFGNFSSSLNFRKGYKKDLFINGVSSIFENVPK